MTVADYEFLGEMHNAFMSNVVNNYIAPNPANHSKNELMDEISEFNSAFAKQSYEGILPDDMSCFKDYKDFLDNAAFNHYILAKKTKSSIKEVEEYFTNETGELEDMPSLESMIDYLHSTGFINNQSYGLLNRIVGTLASSIEGQISDANYCKEIERLIEDFNKLGYSKDDIDGEMVASILAISSASINWWQNNPDAFFAENKLPAVVAADLGGAVTGVVIDGIRQGICLGIGVQHGWDWASTGWAALGGAVDGSLGISSKIIKLFR